MIAYDFEYYAPETVEEAIGLHVTLNKQGKKPVYFSGGTEILTLGRTNRLVTGAVIDIKAIKDCQVEKHEVDEIVFGSVLSLTKIIKSNHFPLLSEVSAQIADHTARNKITLGGNICGNIPYKEAVLPFLLTNSTAVIANQTGIHEHPFTEIFHEQLQLSEEDLLIQMKVKQNDAKLPFKTIKKRRQWAVGYPLMTGTSIKVHGELKIAFSGLCEYPFHSDAIDRCLNNTRLSEDERVKEIVKYLPAPLLNDVHGSSQYRQIVLKNLLQDIIDAFKGANSM